MLPPGSRNYKPIGEGSETEQKTETKSNSVFSLNSPVQIRRLIVMPLKCREAPLAFAKAILEVNSP